MNGNKMTIRQAQSFLQPFQLKTQQIINGYCNQGLIPADMVQGIWQIDGLFIREAKAWRSKTQTMEYLIEQTAGWEKLSEKNKALCVRRIRQGIREYLITDTDTKYCLLFAGRLIRQEDIGAVKQIIEEEVANYQGRQELLSIKEVSAVAGVSEYILKKQLQTGSLKGVRIKNDWFVSPEDLHRYQKQKADALSTYIGSYELVVSLLPSVKTLFDPENQSHRRMLYDWMKQGTWKEFLVPWEQSVHRGDRRNRFYIPRDMLDKICPDIKRYLSGFGTALQRKEMFANDPYWKEHPKTLEALRAFSDGKIDQGMSALLEMIVHTVKPEIMDCSDDDLEELIRYASSAATKIYGSYCAMFITYVKEHYNCRFTVSLQIDREDSRKNAVNTDPYSFYEYSLAGYMALSEDFIQEHGLIAKALSNVVFAVLWLHMLWHYICAWRNSDFYNMKLIPLLHSREEVRDMIQNGTYDKEAEKISLLLEHEINGRHTLPHKTQEEQKTEFLVIVIPESLRSVIGTVYSIVYLHSDGMNMPTPTITGQDYIHFFGPDYERIFGRRPFGNRRANKSFMGFLAEHAVDGTGKKNKLLGYNLGSFVRAHTHKDGKIAETTFKYLKTTMDGYTPEQIVFLLMETGTCSFVPYLLLETVYGETYTRLTFPYQNEIIKQSGVTALTAENMAAMVQKAYFHAQETVNELFREYGEPEQKQLAEQILTSIVERTATGKQLGTACLLAARKFPCVRKSSEYCLGCRFALHGKATLFFAVERIKLKYEELQSAHTEAEKKKITGILETVYLPATFELLSAAKTLYGMDIEPYRTTIVQLMTERGRLK